MKHRTLVFSALAVASVIFWFQTNNGTKETDQPKTVARGHVKSIKLNQESGKSEASYAENKAAKRDLSVTATKPTASTVASMETVNQKPSAIDPNAASLTDETNNPESLTAEGSAQAPKTELPENWAEITQAAIAEPDPQLRGEAIQNLSLYGNTEAIAVLTEASVADPDPNNREKAVQALWNSAADNLDSDDLKSQLEKSRNDSDPFVAELATKAIADLEHLAKRRGRGD
jgi:HEAT repeats